MIETTTKSITTLETEETVEQSETNLGNNEIEIQHGFQSIVIDLSGEKNTTLESLLKKYKDNLHLSKLDSLFITNSLTNNQVSLSDKVEPQNVYVINLKHDSKG